MNSKAERNKSIVLSKNRYYIFQVVLFLTGFVFISITGLFFIFSYKAYVNVVTTGFSLISNHKINRLERGIYEATLIGSEMQRLYQEKEKKSHIRESLEINFDRRILEEIVQEKDFYYLKIPINDSFTIFLERGFFGGSEDQIDRLESVYTLLYYYSIRDFEEFRSTKIWYSEQTSFFMFNPDPSFEETFLHSEGVAKLFRIIGNSEAWSGILPENNSAKELYLTSPGSSLFSETKVVTYSIPLYEKGLFRGGLFFDMSLLIVGETYLSNRSRGAQSGDETMEVFWVITNSNREISFLDSSLEAHPHIYNELKRILKDSDSYELFSEGVYRGRNLLFSQKKLENLSETIYTVIPLERFWSQSRFYLTLFLIVLTFVAAVVIILSKFIYKKYIQPISDEFEALYSSEKTLRYLLEVIPSPTFIIDEKDETILYCNRNGRSLIGIMDQDNILMRPLGEFMVLTEEDIQKIKSNPRIHEADCEISFDSTKKWFSLSTIKMLYQDRRVIFVSLADITERKTEEGILRKMATLDVLTRIPNRRYLMEYGERYFTEHIDTGNYMLLILDIDHFKKINDTYGHQKGDEALQQLVNMTRKYLRKNDFFARYGGEEFIILLDRVDRERGIEVANRIRTLIESTPLSLSSGSCSMTVSIGVASEPLEYESFTEMIKVADKALYCAKNRGRNRVVVFEEMSDEEKRNFGDNELKP